MFHIQVCVVELVPTRLVHDQLEEDPPMPPPFVGEDYFCDAGNEEFMDMTDDAGLQTDPLWDGTDCLCCVSDNPPWFYKQLVYSPPLTISR